MNYQSLLKSRKYRISASLIAGIFFKFFTDIVFGLIYKNYEIFQPLIGYLQALGLSFIVIESFYYTEILLNKSVPWEKSVIRRFFQQLLLDIILILTLFVVLRWIILWVFYSQALVVIFDEIVLIVTLVTIALLYNLLNLGSYFLFQWRHSLAEIERFKKENAEARFVALRNQVNPHFLFNSLNTLSSLMYENIDTASGYIRELSHIFRYSLENTEKELVPLRQELAFLDSYENLLGLRFTNRISFHRTLEEKYVDWNLAPMTIQILIENAMKHNVISTKHPLKIGIVVNNGRLIITNSIQEKSAVGYSSGIGLKNIESRYRFFTQEPVLVDKAFDTFSVSIPLIEPSINNKQG